VRIVLDTNVVISGVFFGGVPGRILSAWSAGEFELVLSPSILEEYRRVGLELGRRYPDVNAAFEPLLTLIAMNALIIDASRLTDPVSGDPDDDMFLAAALASQAQLIVSGDQDLLRVSGWRGIEVVTPRQFSDRHLGA
jgi:putative PIN family toxin of toxin-antitoxin system